MNILNKQYAFIPFLLGIIPFLTDINIMNTQFVNILYLIICSFVFVQFRFYFKFFKCNFVVVTVSLFFLYTVFSSAVHCLLNDMSFPFEKVTHFLCMILVLYSFTIMNSKNISIFWKIVYFLSAFYALLVLVQTIYLNLTGSFMSFLEISQENRPSAFYSEPAHYSMIMFWTVFSALFNVDNLEISRKKRIIFSLLISFSVLMSTSSSGTVYICFCWLCFALFKCNIKTFSKFVLLIVLFIVLYLIFCFSELFQNSIDHLLTLDFSSVNSGGFRIARGFDFFCSLAQFDKIFGYGLGNTQNYISTLNFISIYDNYGTINSSWVSALSEILLDGGYISFISIFLLCIKKTLKSDLTFKLLFFLFFILIFSNEVLYTPQIYYVLCIMIMYEHKMLYNIKTKAK